MWHELTVTFQLRSPLHIGYLPFKGSVFSPTRYYVPGRNLWGALTRRMTELCHDNPQGEDYVRTGRVIMDNFRFSYFYVYDGKKVYMPEYREDGLKYGDLGIHEFEGKFISSSTSTAIMDGRAVDGSLHEIEYINSRFIDDESAGMTMITGCVWLRDDGLSFLDIRSDGIFVHENSLFDELILGGESKYGLGRVVLDSINRVNPPFTVKASDDVLISDEFLRGHMRYSENIRFQGDLELFSGRGYFDPERGGGDRRPGGVIVKPEYYLSPGTFLEDDGELVVSWDGTLAWNEE